MKKYLLLITILLSFAPTVFAQSIDPLPQFTASTSPFTAISPRIPGKSIYAPFSNATTSSFAVKNLVGCATIQTDANGNTSCGTAGTGTLTGAGALGTVAIWSGSTSLTGSSTLTVSALNASSTSQTSYFAGGLNVGGNSALSTIISGLWNGTVIDSQYGGTGQNFSASSGAISVAAGTFSAGTLSIANGGRNNTTIGASSTVEISDGTKVVNYKLSTANMISANVSQFTNDAGYITTSASSPIATSTAETSGYVPYWTSTSGTPATLGSDSGMQYNATADRLTVLYASTTAVSGTYSNFTLASTTALTVSGAGTSTRITGNVQIDGSLKVSGTFYVGSTVFTGLTQNSIPYVGGAGLLTEDNSNLAYDGSKATIRYASSTAISTTNISTGLGAVGAPSLSFTGDANTGLWSSGADTLNFSTGASERIRIDSSGNVGIGTTSPEAKLTVAAGKFKVTYNTTALSDSAVNIGNESGNVNMLITPINAGSRVGMQTYLAGVASGNLSLQEAGGNVGIGTTAPGLRLDVLGVATGAVGLPVTSGTAQSGNLRLKVTSTNNVLDFGVTEGGTGYGWIQSTDKTDLSVNYGLLLNPNGGNVGIGTTSPTNKLEIQGDNASNVALYVNGKDSSTQIIFGRSNSTTGVGRIGADSADALHLLSNTNSTLMTVLQGGNVGIASTTPKNAFDVNGGGYFSGSLFVGGNITATSSAYLGMGTSALVGVATSSPWAQFSVNPNALGGVIPEFIVGSSSKTDFIVTSSGNIGIATTTPTTKLSLGSGSITTTENTIATSTTMTVNWTGGNQQLIRLGASANTINFSNYVAGQILRLVVCNPHSTASTVTWDANVLWSGATAPVHTTTTDKCDLFTFLATFATSTTANAQSVKIMGGSTLNF